MTDKTIDNNGFVEISHIHRRLRLAALVMLAPILFMTIASVGFNYTQGIKLRYMMVIGELIDAKMRLEGALTHLEAHGEGARLSDDLTRKPFEDALRLYSALRGADPDGFEMEEDGDAEARPELLRAVAAIGVDPIVEATRLGLMGHEMPASLAAVWEEADGWSDEAHDTAPLEVAFGDLLLAAEPLVYETLPEGMATHEAVEALEGHFELMTERLRELKMLLQEEASAAGDVPVALAMGVLLVALIGGLFAWLVVFRPLIVTIGKAQQALREEALAAQSAERAKSEFLAAMSHEIRTPMNGVLGMASLLSRTNLDNRQTMLSDVILQSGQQLLRVINDILDFSKVDAGRMKLDLQPFKLSRLAHEPAQIVAHLAETKQLALIVRVQPDLPVMVVGDLARLQQVATNLIGNAVKFTEAGQVYVNVSGISTDSSGTATRMRVEVEDTGPGVPPDLLERIFDRFTQVDGSSTRSHQGSGLGLAIAKGLVELMGGEIGVESTPGRGSTFWFEVPLPVADSHPVAGGVPVHAVGKRVLSVDDNETNRFIVRELLMAWGIDEVSAVSGREALQLLSNAAKQGRPFDAMILDHHMPGLDGAEVLAALRADPEIANIGVVLLSSVDDDRALQGDSAGPDAYTLKPAPASVLFDSLMNALSATAERNAGAVPAAPVAETPEPEPVAETEATAHRGVVLLVEDNHINRLVVKQILADAPMRLVEAHNGAQALEMAAAHRPDVILMDVSMPVMNGLEATRRIRERERAKRLTPCRIIGLTAHALPGDRANCVESGMDDYLSKPVDPDALMAAVMEGIGGAVVAA